MAGLAGAMFGVCLVPFQKWYDDQDTDNANALVRTLYYRYRFKQQRDCKLTGSVRCLLSLITRASFSSVALSSSSTAL